MPTLLGIGRAQDGVDRAAYGVVKHEAFGTKLSERERLEPGELRLLRVDPRTNRIAERVRLPDTAGAWHAGALAAFVRGRR